MFRSVMITALITVSSLGIPAFAQTAPAPTAQPVPAAATATKFSTADSTIGDLIDNPAAKAVLDKHLPGFSTNPQLEMARGMTLKQIQAFVPDQIKEESLVKIDEDLAKL